MKSCFFLCPEVWANSKKGQNAMFFCPLFTNFAAKKSDVYERLHLFYSSFAFTYFI